MNKIVSNFEKHNFYGIDIDLLCLLTTKPQRPQSAFFGFGLAVFKIKELVVSA